jgi:hypothetical protein
MIDTEELVYRSREVEREMPKAREIAVGRSWPEGVYHNNEQVRVR